MGSKAVLLPNAETSSDEELAVLGMRLWPHTFAKTDDIVRARYFFLGQMVQDGVPVQHILSASIGGMLAAQWAHYGYPTLLAGHKFAAALMATKAHVDSMEDIHLPWLAFRCIVPDGLLHLDGEPIDRIMISRRVARSTDGTPFKDDGAPDTPTQLLWAMELYQNGGKGSRLHFYDTSLHGLLTEASEHAITADSEGSSPLDQDTRDMTERVHVLAQRYVLGLLITVQQHPKFGGAAERPVPPTSKRRGGPPTHRTFVLGHPIDVDCRPGIRSYLEGARRSPPSVQTLVIGHWKMQVCGVGRSERKRTWIQPYWRGPVDAPILMRPHRVGHSPSEEA